MSEIEKIFSHETLESTLEYRLENSKSNDGG